MYSVNIYTGNRKRIARPKDFWPLRDQMPVSHVDSVKYWWMLHAQYSPDGRYIAFRMDVTTPSKEPQRMLVTMKNDGSDKVIFGAKPMHFQWYDGQTLMGHDHQVDDGQPDDRSLRRWDRSGRLVETLAGPGCHLGASPGLRWFASESWYGHTPVKLHLYHKGDIKPAVTIFESPYSNIIWDQHVHVNPSFSRSGRRLYLNVPVNDSTFQASYYDFSEPGDQVSRPQVIFNDDFNQQDMSDWKVEAKGADVQIKDGDLDIDAPHGCTVWLGKKLAAPLKISFDVTVVDEGGPNDRVSDMNAFWMAEDPEHPDNLLAERRSGITR